MSRQRRDRGLNTHPDPDNNCVVQCARCHHAGAAGHSHSCGVHGGFYRWRPCMQAAALCMPNYPIVSIPQPYMTSTPDDVWALAETSLEEVLKRVMAA